MAKKQDLKITRRKPKAGRDPGTKELPPELEGLPPLSEQELEPVLLPAKKRKHRHPVARAIARLLLVAAVLTGGFAVWKNWDKLAPEALLDWIDMKLDGADKGDGFPYAISGDTVVAMGQAKNNLALLTDTSLLFINEKGGEIARRSHAYARPLLKTAGSYALVAERGGGRYQLETRRETVLNGKLEGRNILAASLQEDGRFALVTDTASQSYQSELDVFDRKGNVLFSWKSPRLLLTDVALQPRRPPSRGGGGDGGGRQYAFHPFGVRSDAEKRRSGGIQRGRSDALRCHLFLRRDGGRRRRYRNVGGQTRRHPI